MGRRRNYGKKKMGKFLTMYLLVGGAGYAAFYYRSTLKRMFGEVFTRGGTDKALERLTSEYEELTYQMNDALTANDTTAYTGFQKAREIVKFQIENEQDL